MQAQNTPLSLPEKLQPGTRTRTSFLLQSTAGYSEVSFCSYPPPRPGGSSLGDQSLTGPIYHHHPPSAFSPSGSAYVDSSSWTSIWWTIVLCSGLESDHSRQSPGPVSGDFPLVTFSVCPGWPSWLDTWAPQQVRLSVGLPAASSSHL